MDHTIEFTKAVIIGLKISRQQRSQKMRVRKGNRIEAQVRPYVPQTKDGFVEMADLFLDDGASTSGVPFTFSWPNAQDCSLPARYNRYHRNP